MSITHIDEIRQYFMDLPDEREREYEKQIVNLVMDTERRDFEPALTQLLTDEDEAVAFAAFCALSEAHRRNKNYSAQQKLIEKYGHRFESHAFLNHIKLLCEVVDFDYRKHEETLTLARKNAENMPRNAGAWHMFADLVATAYEDAEFALADPPAAHWLQEGLEAVNHALILDELYAKFYCTKGRLLAQQGDFDAAAAFIREAVDLEDSNKSDYAIRINGYLNYLRQIQTKKQYLHMNENITHSMGVKMDEYDAKLKRQQELVQAQMDEVKGELDNSMAKSMEFVGLFAGIISFTIGSISISASMAERSFVGAAGLIIVLMGALLCVFAGFGVVLYGFESKKIRRNLVVFLTGLLIAVAGVLICYALPGV